MIADPKACLPDIEIRGYKWPRRPTAVARARLLGEDAFGRWLGIAQGSPWWEADGSASGVFVASFVQVVPVGTFWTANFSRAEPVVDVDIVLPARWIGDAVEEVDLELDVVRSADGQVRVRDRPEFERVREEFAMPDDVATRARETCAQLRASVERGAEPFGTVGRMWLDRFLDGQVEETSGSDGARDHA